MNSGRQQPPEYVGKNGRIIFNAIGQGASRFYVYDDGPAEVLGKRIDSASGTARNRQPLWPLSA